MALKIHGSPLSPFTRKVTIAALEMELDFESHDLNPYTSAEKLAALNPLKRIPVIEHDGFTLADSSAIFSYFQSRFPGSLTLLPEQPEDLGTALWIEEYADTALFDVISKGVFKPIFLNTLMGMAQDFDTVRDAVQTKLPEPLALSEHPIGRTNVVCGRANVDRRYCGLRPVGKS
jgi:glutathione S-transferase